MPAAALLGVYVIVVAVLMASWWAREIRHGALSLPDRSRAEIRLHVTGELLSAAASLFADTEAYRKLGRNYGRPVNG